MAHEEPKVAPCLFLSMQALESQHDLWQADLPEQTAVITAEDTGIKRHALRSRRHTEPQDRLRGVELLLETTGRSGVLNELTNLRL